MFERRAWMQRAGEYPRSDEEYFGLLARAIFSAGLGPRVVESRWEGIKQAMGGLVPATVALLDEDDVQRLLQDPEMIRNRRKIEAVITNASIFLEACQEYGDFHSYLAALGADVDLMAAVEVLTNRFAYLGRTSASFFLFSAGWRHREDDEQAGNNDQLVTASQAAGV